jgi:hypothetical protein
VSSPNNPAQIRTDSGAVTAIVLGFISLVALVFPPALGLGIAGIVLGWTARRRIARSGGALKGGRIAIGGLVLGVLGTLEGLVLPGFVAYVYLYAAFHGGQVPGNGLP